MGLVYLGEHTLLGRRAAIKTLLPTMSSNTETVERFFNEARATSAIHDAGVIQIFDFGYHVDGTAYIVMELLEGEALAARIARLDKLALGDALRIARQIACSLASAHARDIVHRDLKPDNIFLVPDGEAQGGERTKILDFGICKLGTGDVTLTQSGAMIGTPVYMSPEQCRGDGSIDGRSDIYAFGCLLFHMLAGRPPFIGEASGDLIVAHLEDEAPVPSTFVPGLPPAVDALILRCLAKAPADRWPSMTELGHALGELYAELDAPVEPVAPVAPAMPLGRGFRSLYDGNLTANGASSAVRRRLPWLRYRSENDRPAGAGAIDPPSPRRRPWVRMAVGGMVAVAMGLGLIVTSSVLYGERGEDSVAHAATVNSIETPSPASAAAPAAAPARGVATVAPVAADPARTTAADSVTGAGELRAEPPTTELATGSPRTLGPSTSSEERSRRSHETSRESRTPVKPRQRSADSTDHASALASTTRGAPGAAPAAPAPSAGSAATNPPIEDLYESR